MTCLYLQSVLLAVSVLGQTDIDTCNYEVAFLLDASSGWANRREAVANALDGAIAQLRSEAASVKASVATFVDKPAPELGLGNFGGYLTDTGYGSDWCWNLLQEPSLDASVASLVAQSSDGSGLDMREGHFEAIAHALSDDVMQWSNNTRKIVVVLTDGAPHVNAEGLSATEAVNRFNAPITCEDNGTVGGFGAQQQSSGSPGIAAWTSKQDVYTQYAGLIQKTTCDGSLTADEQTTLDDLEQQLVEISWPSMLPFDASVLKSDPETHCAYHEYPSYEEIAGMFQEVGAELLVFVIDNAKRSLQSPQVQSPRGNGEEYTIWAQIVTQELSAVPSNVIFVYDSQLSDTLEGALVDYLERTMATSLCGIEW